MKKIFVSEETKKATTLCEKEFSCLDNNRDDLCKILSCYNDDVHFILCSDKEPCSYNHKICERVHCECPTRKEIYSKYNI